MNGFLDKLLPGWAAKVAFFLDLLVLGAALYLSSDFKAAFGGMDGFALIASMIASWGIFTGLTRLYSPYTPRRLLDNLTLAVLSSAGLTLVLIFVDRVVLAPPPNFDGLVFLPLASAGIALSQTVIFRPLMAVATPADNVLIVGTGALGLATFRQFAESGTRNVEGFLQFDDDPELPADVKIPVLGKASDLTHVLEQTAVDEVYLADRVMTRGKEMQRLVKDLEEIGVPFAVPLHSLRFNRATLLSSSSRRDGYLHYLTTEYKPVQWATKRMLDIVLATLGLIALSPLLIYVALRIKLFDGGPVLFKQTRVGLHGAHFNFLKFRSMVMNAEALKDDLMKFNEQTGPVFKMQNDPRITPVGRWIRKYSVDELPQLINVLRGDMTIVGPRPPVPKEVAQYKPWQRRRLSVRPGLTCYWQVQGRNEIGFDEWMLLDLKYVDHWSLLTDFGLILKTIPVVLFGKGAS